MPAHLTARHQARRQLTGRRLLWIGLAAVVLAAGGIYLSLGSAPVRGARDTALTSGACHPGAPQSATSVTGIPGLPATPAAGCPSSASTSPSASATPSPARHAVRHHRAPRRSPPPAPTTHPPATPAPPPPSAPAQSGRYSQAVSGVLALINQARAQNGLPAYTITSGLDRSSSGHTQVMASGCGLSHQCQGEPSLGTRETDAGVHWTSAGENIGEAGPISRTPSAIAQAAVGLTQDMINEKPPDDGHRLNILSSSFHHIGISVFIDSHGTVWMTQDFSN